MFEAVSGNTQNNVFLLNFFVKKKKASKLIRTESSEFYKCFFSKLFISDDETLKCQKKKKK